jgi:hypothetical protein
MTYEDVTPESSRHPSPVFAVLFLLFFLEDAEGFSGEIGAIDVFGTEKLTKFVTGEAIMFGLLRDNFDTRQIKQSLPAEHEQSLGDQSDELGKEAVK